MIYMSSVIEIDVKKTGFPVKFGDLDLWFDSSYEHLKTFLGMEDIAQEKLKKAQEKARHVHFPEVIEDVADVEVETVNAAFDLKSEFIAIQYDIVFGEGAFKKIYEVYPDILALENAMNPTFNAIASKINEMEDERSREVEAKKKEYLKKKAQKR